MEFSVCKYHDGGDARMIIHVRRCKHHLHHLPSHQPDQISQDLAQSRIFIKGKASLYYIERKIMEKYGSFYVLDTCNHVEYGNFEKRSILIFENNDKAIAN